MKEIEFQVKLQTKDLYRFTMRHTYVSIGGIFSLLISFGCLGICVANFRQLVPSTIAVLLIVAALFTVIQPVMLYGKCAAQVKRSKDIKDELSYILSEEGITVRQGEEEANIKWYQIRKVVYGGKGIYVYMSPVRAFIFPQECCGERYEEIQRMIGEMVKKFRDYIPEEEEIGEDQMQEGEPSKEEGQTQEGKPLKEEGQTREGKPSKEEDQTQEGEGQEG